ncbi:MAG: CAP domain-containing protein [Chthoniobacterales bacterium]
MKAPYFSNLLKVAALCQASALFFSATAQAGLVVDTSSREQSRVFYNAIYPASQNISTGWTGSVAGSNPGTTSDAFKARVFLRVNFFRAFAGLPAGVTNNPSWSTMDQSAALMMSANGAVDHTPPTSWKCYSTPGATAAGKSNLSLSNYGSDAISGYMEDPGSVNAPVGHRRWILYPETQQMGTGDVPANGSNYSANALWTLDLNHYADERPEVRDGFVAWPPKGFVPYQLVYPRWSFSYPEGDFSSASVSVTRNNVSIPVSVQSRMQGYGENTIVFVPNNLNPDAWSGPVKPADDTVYHVTVSNVGVGGLPQTFSYNVIAFDPASAGSDTPDFAINGSYTPTVGADNGYTVAEQTLATGYQWKISMKAAYTTVVGAESTAGVDMRGTARDSRVRAVGRYSYHLTHPRFTESSFVLQTPVLCTGTTKLNFSSRLTYATGYEAGTVEVSTDGGSQWTPVWSQRGRNNAGERAFAKRSVSLAAYNGREVKVRFRYALRQGSAYTQTNTGVGWYVDNVSFTSGQKLVGTTVSEVSPTPEFNFHPNVAGAYLLQVRSQVFDSYYSDWSMTKPVSAQ